MKEWNMISIKNIEWNNIYLTITLLGNNLNKYNFFVSNLIDEKYILDLQGNKIIINIVNFPKVKLLGNDKWYILAERNQMYQFVSIEAASGYKLDNLDKVYRYGNQKYAYIVTFSVEDYDEKFDKMQNDTRINASDYLNNKSNEQLMIMQMHTSYMMLNRREYHRNILIESASMKQFIKKTLFIFTKRGIQGIYEILSFFRKKDGKHILFMSETRVPIGGNLKAVDDRLKQRGLDKKFKISYSFSKTLQQSKWKTLFTWSRLLWLVSKQDYIFVDDYVPIFKTIHLHKNTKLIQLWHAGVGFKSVGYSRFGKAGSPHPTDSCHRNYDYALVGAKGLIHVYEEVFGIDKDKFLPFGLPRLDGYMDNERIKSYKKKFYEEYPNFQNKKIIMFAPTYRGTTQKDAFYPFDKINQDKLYDVCKEEYIFVYKMHPFIKEKVHIPEKYCDRIFDFSTYGDINSLFYVTDILITDFSSNIYEFALHRKPIIVYAYDKDFYQLTRGVHRTLDEAPGNVCQTFDEVLDVLKNHSFELNKLEDFIKDSFVLDEGSASDRLIDTILLKK